MKKVYGAINAIQAEFSREGITKGRKNQQQGYSFRGIDDVLNALSPLLAKHRLCILPKFETREVSERVSKGGGALFSVVVRGSFDLVSAEDDSVHTISAFGEAMDSADKATNKAMSAAFKYAAIQAFCIPTEGDNDADAHTPEVVPKPSEQEAVIRRAAVAAGIKTAAAFKAATGHDTAADVPPEDFERVMDALTKKEKRIA